MNSISKDTFGPLIAFLIPGAIALFGLSPFIPAVLSWFATDPVNPPSIGGFLYLTVASLAMGMTVSAIRWVVVDTLHSRTGVQSPTLDFSRLGSNVAAMELLIEIQYRHYLFYANAFVAVAIAWVAHRTAIGWLQPPNEIDLAFLVLEPIFWVASRDTLKKYYRRAEQILMPRNSRKVA